MEMESLARLIIRSLLNMAHITQLLPLSFTFGGLFITLHTLHDTHPKDSLEQNILPILSKDFDAARMSGSKNCHLVK